MPNRERAHELDDAERVLVDGAAAPDLGPPGGARHRHIVSAYGPRKAAAPDQRWRVSPTSGAQVSWSPSRYEIGIEASASGSIPSRQATLIDT